MSDTQTTRGDESQYDGQQQRNDDDAASKLSVSGGPASDAADHRWAWVRRIAMAVAGVTSLVLAFYFGLPWLERYFNSVSTDDAYVAGYVTYLGPRIASRVESVLVEENDFVSAGEPLVRLDAEPFRLGVATAEANLELARADLLQVEASVLGDLAQVRANQYLVLSAVDQIRLNIASLRAAVANLQLDQAKLDLAEKDFARISELTELNAKAQTDYDKSLAAVQVAREQVASQQEAIEEIRAELGLERNTENPTEIPDNIEQRNAALQVALSNWAASLLKLGAPPDVVGFSADSMPAEFDPSLPGRIPQRKLEEIRKNTPAVQLARAKVRQAQAALDKAKLDLGYTEIKAPFDGFVTKRSVNPGDYVAPGQNLLAVQSLRDVWIEANFKETQLDDLRIGMPVSVYVDAYPGKVFSARVTGFRPATGSQLSLLPPENATGNFVKVVQRLPVRIELDEPPAMDAPLFVGLSVEPYVRYKEPPRGPHAGQRLRVGPQVSGSQQAVPAALAVSGKQAPPGVQGEERQGGQQ